MGVAQRIEREITFLAYRVVAAPIGRPRMAELVQADGENLNNRLNLIDFAGLFSGNAVAPPRSFALRMQTSF